MILMISSNDMRRLSPECRKELMAVLMSRVSVDCDDVYATESERFSDQTNGEGTDVPAEQAIGMFQQVDLTASQAMVLKANINKEFAQPTLEKLAKGEQIPKTELYGQGGAKQFGLQVIGPVNRRLRNIAGIPKNANLFLFDITNTKIYVSEKTAQSLRVVFDVLEPLPLIGFSKREGNFVVSTSESDPELHARLEEAWAGFSLRPGELSPRVWFESVHKQLAKSGLQLFGGSFDDYNDDTGEVRTYLSPLTEPIEELYCICQKNGIDTFYYGLDANSTVIVGVATKIHFQVKEG